MPVPEDINLLIQNSNRLVNEIFILQTKQTTEENLTIHELKLLQKSKGKALELFQMLGAFKILIQIRQTKHKK